MSIGSRIKMISIFAVAAVSAILLSLAITTGPAHAAPAGEINDLKSGTLKLSYVPGKSLLNTIEFWSDGTQKVSNLKSSKPSIASVKLRYMRNTNTYIARIKIKKAGTTKITCKVGKKKYSVKLITYKYSTPIESLKIGKTDYTNNVQPKGLSVRTVGGAYDLWAGVAMSKSSKKVDVVAADGWKVSRIYTTKYVKKGGKYKPVIKKIKNGGKIKGDFTIDMKNKKTGLVESFYVN